MEFFRKAKNWGEVTVFAIASGAVRHQHSHPHIIYTQTVSFSG
jgi:quercetin dioxygenase-like cupin family protein